MKITVPDKDIILNFPDDAKPEDILSFINENYTTEQPRSVMGDVGMALAKTARDIVSEPKKQLLSSADLARMLITTPVAFVGGGIAAAPVIPFGLEKAAEVQAKVGELITPPPLTPESARAMEFVRWPFEKWHEIAGRIAEPVEKIIPGIEPGLAAAIEAIPFVVGPFKALGKAAARRPYVPPIRRPVIEPKKPPLPLIEEQAISDLLKKVVPEEPKRVPLVKPEAKPPVEIITEKPIAEVKLPAPTARLQITGTKGASYRAFDNPKDAIGVDVSMTKNKPFEYGGAYEIEIFKVKGEEIPHHPEAIRGTFDPLSVKRLFYEPEYFTAPSQVLKDLPVLRKMFPNAEFIRVKLAPDAKTRIAIPHGEYAEVLEMEMAKLPTMRKAQVAEPKTFVQFVRQKGGIEYKPDSIYRGELSRLSSKESGIVGLVSKEGKPIDRIVESSIESGWLPKGASVTDFLDLIEQDVSGAKFGKPRPIPAYAGAYTIGGYPPSAPKMIEMPEIVQLAKEINEGKYPSVWQKLRVARGQATGYLKIKGKEAEIRLKAGIFAEGIGVSEKTLAHEVGHLVDWLPDKTLKRGNILGRIATLRKYMKEFLAELPKNESLLISVSEKNYLRREAIKEGKRITTDPGILKKTIRGIYQQKLKELAESKGLLTKEEITTELKNLTQTWNPFDESASIKYTKYRHSSKELYADTLGVLVNDPELLRTTAPRFHKAFFDYFERKPEVKTVYNEIQDLVGRGKDETFESRDIRINQMFEAGEEAYRKKFEIPITEDPFWTKLKTEMTDRNAPILDRFKNDNIKFAIDDNVYREVEGEAYFGEFAEKALKPLDKSGLTHNDMSKLMYLDRVINERSKIANPEGFNSKTAQEQRNWMKSQMGDEKFMKLEQANKTFWEVRKEYIINRLKEANLFTDELMEMIESNQHYATFDVVEHISNRYGLGPGAKVYKQIGTLKPIADTVTATILKDLSMIRAVNLKNAAKATTDGLFKDYPNLIRPSRTIWNGKTRVPVEPREEGWGMISYLEEGKIKGYDVPKGIAEAFEHNPIDASLVTKILSASTLPFRQLFINKRPGFWVFNVFRDVNAAIKVLPRASVVNFLPVWKKSFRTGVRGVTGYSETIQEMRRAKALMPSVDRYGMDTADVQLERMMIRHGMLEPKKSNLIIRGLRRFLGWFDTAAGISEITTKVAAWKYLKEKFPQMSTEEMAYRTRRAGSPAFQVRGKMSGIYNNAYLFSNAMEQGYRAQYESFKERPAEYAWKTVKYQVIPKILMWGASAGLLGESIRRIYEAIGEYDLTNYHIIPLGQTPQGKAVYLRVPQDEVGRLTGGVIWKMLKGMKTPQDVFALFDYTAGQFPGLNPAISMFFDLVSFLSGQNPYDEFYGKMAIPEAIFKAQDMRTVEAFGKYLSNKAGLGIVYKFQNEDVERVKTELEKVIGFPVTSDIIGRFIKVSDRGIQEKLQEAAKPVAIDEARLNLDIKEALTKAVNDEPLSEEDIMLIQSKPDLIDRNLQLMLTRKYGLTFVSEYLKAPSKAQKQAIVNKMMELEQQGGTQ